MNVRKGIPFSIIFCLFLIPFFFQNCAQQKFGKREIASIGTTKLVSPFEKQKVIIDFKSLYSRTKTPKLEKNGTTTDLVIPALSHLVVNINNQCAVGFCENEKNKNSQSCQLFTKYFDKRLKNSTQAYVYLTDKDYTQKEFENYMFSQEIDNFCIVGISQRESYSIKFDSTSAEYLASYHHQIIKTDQVYDFFLGEFKASSETLQKSQVRVGIIDTGVDFSHSEFPSEVKGKQMNFSASCPTSICNFHGTFVAGIIAAQLNGNQGSFGIAPNSVIYSYQVGDKNGSIPSEELVNAIKQATVDGVEVLNLSLGGSAGVDASYQTALTEAINNNVLIVAAAGNSNNNLDLYPSYPPSFGFEGIVSVGAASPSLIAPLQPGPPTVDQIASTIKRDTFSNYSAKLIGIAAPGTAIFSTTTGGSYGVASGTSFSAPMVTGAMVLARGYLKLKDFSSDQITATLLKSLLYDSAEILPSLTEKVASNDITYFTNNRFLNLAKLKNYVVDYCKRVASSPSRIELTGFDVIKNEKGAKVAKFKIEVKDADPTLNLTMRVYTNRAFKDESELVTAQCLINLSRKICTFDIPFDNLMVDPEVYLEITDTRGVIISSLTIPKQNLNFGIKSDSSLAGEIVEVSLAKGKPIVEGWACLVGFPDRLEIEIRKDNPETGDIVDKIKPTQQARGNYYSLCDSSEITFGFLWNVPNADKYYFIARHPTVPSKNIVIKAFSYLPKFEDPLPAEFVDYIQIDKNWSSETPQYPKVSISQFSMEGLQVHVKGSACFENIYKPTIVSLGFDSNRLLTMFDDPNTHSTVPANSVQEAKTYSYYQRHKTYLNDDYINRNAEKDNLGILTFEGEFSDIAQAFSFNDKTRLLPKSYSSSAVLLTQYPSIIENRNCPLPSAFEFNMDISKNIWGLSAGGTITYRPDKVTIDQIIKDSPNFVAFLDRAIVSKNFSDLSFNKMSLYVNFYTNYSTKNLLDTWGYLNPKPSMSEFKRDPAGLGVEAMDPFLQYLALDKNISSTSDSLETVWESDWIVLAKPTKGAMAIFEFDNGIKFGTIGEDFTLQVLEEDKLTLTQAFIDISAIKEMDTYSGKIYAEIFTKNINSKLKIKLLSNKKNQMHLISRSLITL